MDLPIPIQVLYAGLGGTLLALIVATAQQRWQPKVFFLLALRLAIGWHFLFEGLYKVNTHLVAPTDTTPRAFSSKPYFDVAPTAFGAYMRRQFDDPGPVIDAKVKAPKPVAAEAFDKLKAEEQAAACPKAVADALDAYEAQAEEGIRTRAEKAKLDADASEAKAAKAAKSDADRAKAKEAADKSRAEATKAAESSKEAAKEFLTAAKARYARWVYGVDGRPAKVKYVTGEPSLTAPQRLEHLDWLRKQVEEGDSRLAAGLGNGYGTDQKRSAEVRQDLTAAETQLAKDANDFVAELVKNELLVDAEPAPAEKSRGQRMDQVTMWFLVAVGGCLLLGLFTRLACLGAVGFLTLTYLTHPPFPWYPLPPNTEGNPLFINKNVIEGLALLALACMPTGRWLGLDALVMRWLGFREKVEA